MKYTIYNPDTLEVLYVTQDLDESPQEIILEQEIIDDEGEVLTPAVTMTIEFVKPENSLPFEGCSFIKPMINQYPNPTHLVEGLNEEEIEQYFLEIKLQRVSELNLHYTNAIDELIKAHVQRLIIDGTPIPLTVLEQRTALRLAYRDDYYIIMGEYPDETLKQ